MIEIFLLFCFGAAGVGRELQLAGARLSKCCVPNQAETAEARATKARLV